MNEMRTGGEGFGERLIQQIQWTIIIYAVYLESLHAIMGSSRPRG